MREVPLAAFTPPVILVLHDDGSVTWREPEPERRPRPEPTITITSPPPDDGAFARGLALGFHEGRARR